jgi:cobalt-zinc-cadmium efflux system outer membrane protein
MQNLAVLLLAAMTIALSPAAAIAQDESQPPVLRGTIQAPQSQPGMSLPDLQRIAEENNPTLKQAESNVQAARGRAKQAGLMPNPVIGYQGEEYAFKYFDKKSEHFGFFEQTIPLGGKLRKARQIYVREAERAEIELAAQRQRIRNAIRSLYFDVLGAQRQVELQTELARIAQDAVNTTVELFNVGQSDKPDNLQAQIEAEQVQHDLQVAQNHLVQSWRLLAAVVGKPDMPVTRLQGSLEERVGQLDESRLLNNLLETSPQILAAQARIKQAAATLVRAKAEPIPDLFVRGALGYSTEYIDLPNSDQLKRTGPEANVQIGMSVPLWNRNQGGIATARADLAYATAELSRLKLQLRGQFAQAVQDYNNALDAVQRYQGVIIPRADEAYRLYLQRFKEMGASYPQVLISQRTMFLVRRQYINALVGLQQNATQLEGLLLTGGLRAPQLAAETAGFNDFVQHTETAGVRSGTDNALDTAGLVEY